MAPARRRRARRLRPRAGRPVRRLRPRAERRGSACSAGGAASVDSEHAGQPVEAGRLRCRPGRSTIAIRSIVEIRLSFSGPRMAFWTKFGPPWPTVLTRRALASSICFFSSARLRSTSACARAGMAGSSLGHAGAHDGRGSRFRAAGVGQGHAQATRGEGRHGDADRHRRSPAAVADAPVLIDRHAVSPDFRWGTFSGRYGVDRRGRSTIARTFGSAPRGCFSRRLKFPRMISSDDCPTDRYCRPPRALYDRPQWSCWNGPDRSLTWTNC